MIRNFTLSLLAIAFALTAQAQTTEDFESGTPFASTFGEWTFVDADNSDISMLLNIDFSTLIDNGSKKQSFWLMAPNDERLSGKEFVQPHSGNLYLTQMVCATDWNTYETAQCDDWAISPELSGNAQTIKFWARGFDAEWGETFQVLCSTTNKETASFTQIGADYETTGWKEYSVELPAGAKYFAIRCTSWDVAMFMFDDVTYEGVATAIHNVNAQTAGAKYYDLNGRLVAEPAHGVFVKVVNGKSQKVIL